MTSLITTQQQQQQKSRKPHKRIIYDTAYEVISIIFTMQQEQDAYLKNNQGKRHSYIAKSDQGQANLIRVINHRYHLKASVASTHNIFIRMGGPSYQTVVNTLRLLKAFELIKFSRDRLAYTVTQKGIEFMIIYEDLSKVFPLPTNYKDMYHLIDQPDDVKRETRGRPSKKKVISSNY